MKKLKKGIGIGLIVISVLCLLPVVVLKIPYIQREIGQTAAHWLETKTGTEVTIQSIDFHPFNKLILKNIYWKDAAGDTLLTAQRLAVGFEFLPLFRQQYRIRSAQLNTFTLHINKETENSPFNIEAIIDAFRSQDTIPSPVDLQIKKIRLYNGTVAYRVKNQPVSAGNFNASDIGLREIYSTIQIKELAGKRLELMIEKLRFKEKSGFKVDQLVFDLKIAGDSVQVPHLELQLPHSQLNLSQIEIQTQPLNIARAAIDSSSIYLNDIQAFLPVFDHCYETIAIQGNVSGNADEIRLNDLNIASGSDLTLGAEL
ncbi:MAG: hypothetical protein LBG77_03215, partial [Dysgonamonadaceae bacterium]|nr:hypothetical protein [Dysgonamonadaceae bacterium]